MECTCFPVPEEYWTTHYGAVDPATTHEPNPECPVHFSEPRIVLGFDPATTGSGLAVSAHFVVTDGVAYEFQPGAESFTNTDWLQARQRVEPVSKSFEVTDLDHDLLFPPKLEKAFAATIDYKEPDLPPLYGKGPNLTGKAYRKYRRMHRRLRQAWKKAGKPTRKRSVYFPRAEILFSDLGNTFTVTAKQAERAAQAMRHLGDSWANHPSNWEG